VTDWGGGMSASCKLRSNCSLMRAMVGRIERCGIISSCQSAATSEIVKRYSKYWTLRLPLRYPSVVSMVDIGTLSASVEMK